MKNNRQLKIDLNIKKAMAVESGRQMTWRMGTTADSNDNPLVQLKIRRESLQPPEALISHSTNFGSKMTPFGTYRQHPNSNTRAFSSFGA
jgi:hypothetical protein